MATVEKREHKKVAARSGATQSKVRRESRKRKTLSTKLFQPSENFEEYVKVIYGDIGIGKTTLALEQPGAYALMFDPNRSFECYQDIVTNWQDMIDLTEQLIEGKHNYSNIITDGVHIAYEMALDYACKKYGFEHPGNMNDYGASWNKVKKTFMSPIRQLINSKYGITLICHAAEKDIETRSGRRFVVMQPELSKQASEAIVKPFDNVFYYTKIGNERFLQIEGDDYITAKNRMRGHFLTVNGEKIFRIPMGDNEKQSYKNLIAAYKNKQAQTFATAGFKLDKKKGGKKLAVKKRK